MRAHVATLEVELHLPMARSLKAKRAIVRPLTEGLRRRFQVAVAEVDYQDLWQRAGITVAAVAGTAEHVSAVLDSCERYVWAQPDLEVTACRRRWLEDD